MRVDTPEGIAAINADPDKPPRSPNVTAVWKVYTETRFAGDDEPDRGALDVAATDAGFAAITAMSTYDTILGPMPRIVTCLATPEQLIELVSDLQACVNFLGVRR